MSFYIRRMREEDIPQAVEIEQIAFTRPWSKTVFKATLLLPYAAYYAAVEADPSKTDGPGPENSAGEERSERDQERTAGTQEGPAQTRERIIGICGVKKIFETGEISNVAVHPDYRGRGISRHMLETLMREAREDGVEEFTLEVRAGNAVAVGLYESLGFRTEAVRPRFYDKPVEDGLIMWLRK